MSIFDKEEVVAPTQEAAIAQAIKPVLPASDKCTRDTRGNADCAVKNCENCN
jgi:hypothetical protein